jgi:hypothetical protein
MQLQVSGGGLGFIIQAQRLSKQLMYSTELLSQKLYNNNKSQQ